MGWARPRRDVRGEREDAMARVVGAGGRRRRWRRRTNGGGERSIRIHPSRNVVASD
jgi:hypothetical protein